MKIYLDARTRRQQELLGYAAELKKLGHTITARWLYQPRQNDQGTDELGNSRRRQALANQDYADIDSADLVLVFSELPGTDPKSRGRRHVEMGIAIGAGKKVCVVGPRENVYAELRTVDVYPGWPEAVKVIGRAKK